MLSFSDKLRGFKTLNKDDCLTLCLPFSVLSCLPQETKPMFLGRFILVLPHGSFFIEVKLTSLLIMKKDR